MHTVRFFAGDWKIVLGFAKFHENRLRIDWENGEKHALKVIVTSTNVILAPIL